MSNTAILGSLLTRLCHSVVTNNGRNAQAVVPEDAIAAGDLRRAMAGMTAPGRDRSFISPEGQRQQLIGVGKALESFNRNESVHALQVAAQPRGVIQVVSLAAIGGPHLKDDGNHGLILCLNS